MNRRAHRVAHFPLQALRQVPGKVGGSFRNMAGRFPRKKIKGRYITNDIFLRAITDRQAIRHNRPLHAFKLWICGGLIERAPQSARQSRRRLKRHLRFNANES
jgi:hypothetical protein